MMLQHNADRAELEKERREEARRLERQAELASRERQQRFYLSGGGCWSCWPWAWSVACGSRPAANANSRNNAATWNRPGNGLNRRALQGTLPGEHEPRMHAHERHHGHDGDHAAGTQLPINGCTWTPLH